jgi:aspartate aminotransferase
LAALKDIPGLSCETPQGAFYLFIDVSQARTKLGLKNDVEFSSLLLNQAEVAVVPGSAFGTPDHIRISYATRDDVLEKAFQRMKVCLSTAV